MLPAMRRLGRNQYLPFFLVYFEAEIKTVWVGFGCGEFSVSGLLRAVRASG